VRLLRERLPTHPAHDDFVFTTPTGAPIDQPNFDATEIHAAKRRSRWAGRGEVALSANPLFFVALGMAFRCWWMSVARNTRSPTTKRLLSALRRSVPSVFCHIEEHYGDARMSHTELDALIADARDLNRNLTGTLAGDDEEDVLGDAKSGDDSVTSTRAGDRGRTGDVQLGKLRKRLNRKP
jgi:hypothetical protein